MNKPLTINELLKLCKEQVKLGNGNKTIMISNDDEGNGYHYLWYAFTRAKEIFDEDEYLICNLDKRIATLEDTFILG